MDDETVDKDFQGAEFQDVTAGEEIAKGDEE